MEWGVDPALRGVAFISYVREDRRRVDRLEEFLKAHGVPVWRDIHDVGPGEDWHAKIREAIAADSLVFIACFSRNSEARQRSYQRDELLLAIEQFRLRPPERPYILPIRFDDCDIPDLEIGGGRTLNSLNYVDLFGRQWHASAERLLEAVITLAAVGVYRLVGNESPGGTPSRSPSGAASGSLSGSPTLPPGVRVTDNSGDISAVVPQSWGLIVGNGWHPRLQGSFNGSFIGPGFNATTNFGDWLNDLTTPGIFVGASKLLVADHYNPVTALGTFAPSCTFSSSKPVTADGLTGYRDMWKCPHSTTGYETVAMWPKDHSFIAYIELKIVTPVDEANGNRVLASLSIRY
jgi:hypothetical protein